MPITISYQPSAQTWGPVAYQGGYLAGKNRLDSELRQISNQRSMQQASMNQQTKMFEMQQAAQAAQDDVKREQFKEDREWTKDYNEKRFEIERQAKKEDLVFEDALSLKKDERKKEIELAYLQDKDDWQYSTEQKRMKSNIEVAMKQNDEARKNGILNEEEYARRKAALDAQLTNGVGKPAIAPTPMERAAKGEVVRATEDKDYLITPNGPKLDPKRQLEIENQNRIAVEKAKAESDKAMLEDKLKSQKEIAELKSAASASGKSSTAIAAAQKAQRELYAEVEANNDTLWALRGSMDELLKDPDTDPQVMKSLAIKIQSAEDADRRYKQLHQAAVQRLEDVKAGKPVEDLPQDTVDLAESNEPDLKIDPETGKLDFDSENRLVIDILRNPETLPERAEEIKLLSDEAKQRLKDWYSKRIQR